MVNIRQWFVLGMMGLSGASLADGRPELSEADFLAELPVVLTASRLAQALPDAPNSITVIDRKLIEASGYHSLSDLFRLVPGMFVGQDKGWFHSVSRTLVEPYARRMQVLVDGRSIYQPSFGGVRWDALPLAVDDIERIEVVRGPNAASFGANAFTGVINIITRHPEDVAGRLLHLVVGDHAHREAWFRWAGTGESASHRITLGWREDGGLAHQGDNEDSSLINYRGDFRFSGGAGLSLQLGALYGDRDIGKSTEPLNLPHTQDVEGFTFQGVYHQPLSPERDLTAKFSVDRLLTEETVPAFYPGLIPPGSTFPLDLFSRRWHGEFQVDSRHGESLRSSVGAYLRRDEVRSPYYYGRDDKLRADSWGAFAHGELRLSPHWLINAGAFYEDHDLAAGRWSPRATLHWQPHARHSLRVGVSRAYRNPVMFETDVNWWLRVYDASGTPLPLPVTSPYFLASGSVEPERMLSQEIGYLGRWPEWGLDLDLRLFRERIDGYISAECPSSNRKDCAGPLPKAPRDFRNIGGTDQTGLEGQFNWQPREGTRLIANYAFLDIDSQFDEKRYSPAQQYGLHLMQRLPGRIDLTLSHYWIPEFRPIGMGGNATLPAYTRLDARLARNFNVAGMGAKLALTWQNLTGKYIEFSDNLDTAGQPENVFDTRAYLHFQLDF